MHVLKESVLWSNEFNDVAEFSGAVLVVTLSLIMLRFNKFAQSEHLSVAKGLCSWANFVIQRRKI